MPSAQQRLHEKIIDAIATTGCYVGESILTRKTTAGLRLALQQLHRLRGAASVLRPARISETGNLAPEWRGDSTAWLSTTPNNQSEAQAIVAINALRLAFNKAFFTALSQTQLHYAHYPIGAFYKHHFDRFSASRPAAQTHAVEPSEHRVISLVFYLNDQWVINDGGELMIYHADDRLLQKVPPRSGTMVAFRSELFPHEVLPAMKSRLSLTGWMVAAV
jgi:SM-20-related protein